MKLKNTTTEFEWENYNYGNQLMLGKVFLYIIAIVVLLGSVLLRYSDNPLKEKYDEIKYVTGGRGIKWIADFGIRRFEIFRLTKDMQKNIKRWVLYDSQGSCAIEEDAYSYIELNPYVYTIGDEGYTKLNYEIAEVTRSKEASEFSKEDQKIFKKLEAEKIKAIR